MPQQACSLACNSVQRTHQTFPRHCFMFWLPSASSDTDPPPSPPPPVLPPFYSPPPLFCRGRSCWCSPLAVPLADSPRLHSELTQEAPCPHFLPSSYTRCQLRKRLHSLQKALKKINLSLAFFYYVIPRPFLHFTNPAHARCTYLRDSSQTPATKQDACCCRSQSPLTCQLQN